MYKQYWNDYEKRAEQIRKAARAVENSSPAVVPPAPMKPERDVSEKPAPGPRLQEEKGLASFLERFDRDDILIMALLFLLLTGEDKDMTMIVILGYLLLSGF